MERKHRDLLIVKRCQLVENVNIRDGLYTQLITRKIFNQRTVRTIKNGKTPDEQIEELLDILPLRGPEAFNKFCEALIADDQEHVVEEFLKLELQTAKPEPDNEGNEDHTKKRKRSPSPECLSIKTKKDGDLVVKFLSDLRSVQCSEKTKFPEKSLFTPGESRFSSKHFISQLVPEYSGQHYIPVPTTSTEHHHHYYHQQCSEPQSPTPGGLGRCDSIDAMHNVYKRQDSNGNDINKGNNSSTSSTSGGREEDSENDNYVDNDIDLTDGEVTAKVLPSTRQFYITHHKQSYPMKRMPRGRALIINVNEVKGKTARKGTDIDRDNLHYLLLQLHFDVLVYNDKNGLTAKELYEKVADFSQLKEHEKSDACFICLLSHGEEGYIYGTDGEMLALNAIYDLFNNNKCPLLKGKPKIFIVQACRGGSFDRGVSVDETDGGPAISVIKQLPTLSDMIIGYPTQAGYYAWRNRERGSWYIEAIVHVFIKHAKHDDICTLFNRVNSVVSRKISRTQNTSMDQMSQMSEYISSLRWPHLYFFPGIGAVAENAN